MARMILQISEAVKGMFAVCLCSSYSKMVFEFESWGVDVAL